MLESERGGCSVVAPGLARLRVPLAHAHASLLITQGRVVLVAHHQSLDYQRYSPGVLLKINNMRT